MTLFIRVLYPENHFQNKKDWHLREAAEKVK